MKASEELTLELLLWVDSLQRMQGHHLASILERHWSRYLPRPSKRHCHRQLVWRSVPFLLLVSVRVCGAGLILLLIRPGRPVTATISGRPLGQCQKKTSNSRENITFDSEIQSISALCPPFHCLVILPNSPSLFRPHRFGARPNRFSH